MFKLLDDHLAAMGISSLSLRKKLADISRIEKITKGTDIFEEGAADGCEYLVLKGVLHRYNLSAKADRITTGFYMPGNIVSPHFSRTKNGSSIFTLQALTDASVAAFPVADLQKLHGINSGIQPAIEKIVQDEMENLFFYGGVFRSYSAKERLLFFREHFPNLENIVPHHLIASFLGITNVTFSRLRHDLVMK